MTMIAFANKLGEVIDAINGCCFLIIGGGFLLARIKEGQDYNN